MLRLPALRYQRLRVFLEAREPVELPPFKGSMLRGALGSALQDLACAWDAGGRPDCRECPLKAGCAYTRLMEPFVDPQDPQLPERYRKVETAPRPYVIEPIGEFHHHFENEDLLGFELLLFGRAVELGGAAAVACSRMAEGGLGVRRARFRMTHVLAEQPDGRWKPVCGEPGPDGRRTWRAPTVGVPLPTRVGRLPVPSEAHREATSRATPEWTLKLETPLYLRSRGRTVTALDVPTLTEAAWRRLADLASFHGESLGPSAQEDLELGRRWSQELARRVRLTRTRLRLRRIRRYSNRQKKSLFLEGLQGELHLAGPVEPLIPLFAAAEVLHLGKATAFGLGKVRLRPSSPLGEARG